MKNYSEPVKEGLIMKPYSLMISWTSNWKYGSGIVPNRYLTNFWYNKNLSTQSTNIDDVCLTNEYADSVAESVIFERRVNCGQDRIDAKDGLC